MGRQDLHHLVVAVSVVEAAAAVEGLRVAVPAAHFERDAIDSQPKDQIRAGHLYIQTSNDRLLQLPTP